MDDTIELGASQPDLGAQIDPKEWVIKSHLILGGVTYSRGESVPPMTLGEAERFRVLGQLLRVGGEQSAEPQRRRPESAEEYLGATDEGVLRRLLDFEPPLETVVRMEELVRMMGRSRLLLTTLQVIIQRERAARISDATAARLG